jgi:hypothetical protein
MTPQSEDDMSHDDTGHVPPPDFTPDAFVALAQLLRVMADPKASKAKLDELTLRQAAVTAGEAALAERSAAFERDSAAATAKIEKDRAAAAEMYAGAKAAERETKRLQGAVRDLANALEPKRRAVAVQWASGGGQSRADESLLPPEEEAPLPQMVSSAIAKINAAHKFDDDAGRVPDAPEGLSLRQAPYREPEIHIQRPVGTVAARRRQREAAERHHD